MNGRLALQSGRYLVVLLLSTLKLRCYSGLLGSYFVVVARYEHATPMIPARREKATASNALISSLLGPLLVLVLEGAASEKVGTRLNLVFAADVIDEFDVMVKVADAEGILLPA